MNGTVNDAEFRTEIMSPDDPALRLDQLLLHEFHAAGWFDGDSPSIVPSGTFSGQPLILVLVDGLGWWNLQAYLGYTPNLRRLVKSGQVSGGEPSGRSVCPSTTAAAITSILTGLAPGAHNMLSYQLTDPVVQAKFNLITFDDYPGEVEEFQDQDTWFERLQAANIPSFALGPKKFIGGGLTRAALRGAKYVASENLEARARDAVEMSKRGGLTYFYMAEVDHAGHGYGVGSEKWLRNLEKVDRAIGVMLDHLPSGVRVVITADHGMINTAPEVTVDLAHTSVADLIAGVSGEGRALHLQAQRNQGGLLREKLRELLPGATILTREETTSWFATYNGVALRRPELIGDVVIFADGVGQVLDSRFFKAQVFQMKGLHGGLTEQEMRIPLLRYES